MQEIKVTFSDEFGKKKFYPACDAAELFCRIAGRGKGHPAKSLTRDNIEAIKQLGFTVTQVPAEL